MASMLTLLVVDDDPTIRLLASSGLKRKGYEVLQAPDAEQAIALCRDNVIDLALIDVNMPGRNGFELVTSIRRGEAGSASQQIPLLMLTGSDDVASIDKAFESGATDFITKPINLPLLAERVKYALRGAAREKALRDTQVEQVSACKLARLGFWQLSFDDGALTWSPDAGEVLQWEELPHHRDALLALLPSTDRLRLDAALNTAEEGGGGINLEVTAGSGQFERKLRLQSGSKNADNQLVGAFQDVTAQRAFEDKAVYLSEYDELTDLPKRRLFLNLLDEQLSASPGVPWVLIVIDISRLHRINDVLGIQAGDQVLALFAQRLKQSTPADALMCRLEADTFGVAIPQAAEEEVEHHYHSWLMPLARACVINNAEVFVDFTAGGSLYPREAATSEELLRTALLAQRFSRHQAVTQRLVMFSEVDVSEDESLLSLETDLRKALGREEFFLVYQPQQYLGTGEIVGVEALLRWRHHEKGVISPATFIPLLEESGLIVEVGDWVIQEACRQLAEWQRKGLHLCMGVNLSALQFEQSGLAKRIAEHVAAYGLKPHQLELEITESTAMSNPEATLAILHELKGLGFRIAIDDFGTGHSSYEYLLRFPLDTLKIDRSFVVGVAESRASRAIIRSLTALSQGLGLKTIAEGVETQRQRDYLDALDTDEIQGFLLARPMEPPACLQFLQKMVASESRMAETV
ncbi:putative bifunctional diguanylate cyclase/phosphodiesterase [Vreelandella aquamarina]|uniref:putative bifunctional diguanylate cyclase/phosphodiesterase n=1 Tax=Vreelandella aquamarina TaxID=77097 RepID=UPI00384E70C0